MNDVLVVDVGHGLNDLPHEGRARPLRQHELVLDDAVEQLTAADAKKYIFASPGAVVINNFR